MKNRIYLYYVEGQDEEKIVNVLKTNLRLIKPGKVQKINVNQDFIHISNLDKKLTEHNFDINKFWSSKPEEQWKFIENKASVIKQ